LGDKRFLSAQPADGGVEEHFRIFYRPLPSQTPESPCRRVSII
jgi:hypothetical protein